MLFTYLGKKEYCRVKSFTKIKMTQTQHKNIPLNLSEKKASNFTQKHHQRIILLDLISLLPPNETGLSECAIQRKEAQKPIHLKSCQLSVSKLISITQE